MDASSETLVLERDKALSYYRNIKQQYGNDEFLVITYSPQQPLFNEAVLSDIALLQQRLGELSGVSSVVSILTVPLIQSPPMTLSEVAQNVITLQSPNVDVLLAEQELTSSPLYRNLLISEDASTTAMQINLALDSEYEALQKQRDALYQQEPDSGFNIAQRKQLNQLQQRIKKANTRRVEAQAALIDDVRSIMDKHRANATLFLGGVPMIAADSVAFISNDLVVFGAGVLIFLILTLVIIFHQIRWVVIPLLICSLACVSMLGILGWLDWPVTVVSSNFISLMLIITLSLTIHLIVRYRECQQCHPSWTSQQLVVEAVSSKVVPCFYTAITTMVAFGSLLVSGIRPVMDFGWMMVIGLAIAFILAFTLFPAIAIQLQPKPYAYERDFSKKVTLSLAKPIAQHPILLGALFVGVLLFSAWGISLLSVENRFIDYFKDDTEIHQGMLLIDRKLGGTTPLDVMINAPAAFYASQNSEEDEAADVPAEQEGYDPELGFDPADLALDDGTEASITTTSYWFNMFQLPEVARIHEYLESLPETGKVMSLSSSISLLKILDRKVAEDNFLLAVFHKRLPDTIKNALITPYMSEDGNQVRFSIRVYDSDPNLNRQQLIKKIRADLVNKLGLAPEQIRITGMLVLYNNLLQSLFESQILTIGVVFLMILAMFMLLFKNLKLALIAITPNMLAAALVLGIMGWLNIPLDIMTITIAAIVIGIAVDNSIHYVHRFRHEFSADPTLSYPATVKICHGSIGKALYFTSITVTLGFSILVLSNFVPTVYFGVLTGFSMIVALLANLTLLPLLLVVFEPFGTRD